MFLLLLVYTLLQILLLHYSEHEKSKSYYVPIKLLCSIAFVAVAGIFAVQSVNYEYFLMMLPSLLLCLLGDVFMGIFNQFHRKRYMLLGLLLFLSAHIGFLILLFHIQPQWILWDVLVPIVGISMVMLIIHFMRLHMGKLRIGVLIYSIFISGLLAKSVHYMIAVGSTTAICMGIGGILFFLSDFLILFLYFYHFKSKKLHHMIHYLNLLTYYYGLYLFGMSILYYG